MKRWLDNLPVRKRLLLSFGAIILMVAMAGSTTFLFLQQTAARSVARTQSSDIIRTAQFAMTDLVNMESGFRGFLLTGDEAQLAPYRAGDSAFAARLDSLRTHAGARPEQVARWTELADAVAAWRRDATEPGIAVRRGTPEGAAADPAIAAFVADGAGAAHTTRIRTLLNAAIADELAVLAQRTHIDDTSMATLKAIIPLLTLLVVSLGVSLAFATADSFATVVQRVSGTVRHLQETCISQLADGLARLARGDLNGEITASTEPLALERADEFGRLGADVDRMRESVGQAKRAYDTARGSVRRLVATTGELTVAAQRGELAVRGDSTPFEGEFQAVVIGFNRTLEAVVAPLQEAVVALEALARRDLATTVQGHYAGDHARILNAITLATGQLADAMTALRASGERVSAASTEIADGASSLSDGAASQAGALAEVHTALESLRRSADRNAHHAQSARDLGDATRDEAQRSVAGMTELVEAMSEIRTASDRTTDIVRTIDGIAFQTNLLALNAAVEAARAGDAGRGFAVVAEEVRALALRSAEASRTTAELLEHTVHGTERGSTLAQAVARDLAQLQERIAQAGDMMQQVADASAEQREDVQRIASSIEQVNRVTQRTSSAAEESASSAAALADEATRQFGLIASFTLPTRDGALPSSRSARPGPASPSRPARTARVPASAAVVAPA
jgi:methyl-accepting chemotaxis protein